MLRVMHLEEISALLLRLPELVQQQSSRAAGFAPNVVSWLDRLEKAFAASRLYQTGTVAMLRAGIISVEQGQLPSGIEFRSRPTRTRVLNATAAQALRQAAELAAGIIAEHRPRLAEAERMAQQIAAATVARGLLPLRDASATNTDYLRMLRRRLAASEDLQAAFVHLEGLVGPHDALVLFDRALSPHLDGASLGREVVPV